MSKKILLLIAILTGLLFPAGASAHELLKDKIGSAGVLLHTDPDDAAVAGGNTTLFFDLSDSSITPQTAQAVVAIIDDHGAVAHITPTFAGSTITAHYVFPRPGDYNVWLTITQSGKATHQFSERLSVSDGTSSSKIAANTPVWSIIGIVVTVLLAVNLVVLIFIRHKAIQKYSKQ